MDLIILLFEVNSFVKRVETAPSQMSITQRRQHTPAGSHETMNQNHLDD